MEPTECEFVFPFTAGSVKCCLTAPIAIPLSTSIQELCSRLINLNRLPCYLEPELLRTLKKFFRSQSRGLEDRLGKAVLDNMKASNVDVAKLGDWWQELYTQEVLKFAGPGEITNEELFSDIYHTLVHSSALEVLLSLEHSHTIEMSEAVTKRDVELKAVADRQSLEMETAVRNVGVSVSAEDVNDLAARQFDEAQLLASRWESHLCAVQETQKRGYREWVMRLYEKIHTSARLSLPKPLLVKGPEISEESSAATVTPMEESFTIHLGAQMKQMHNLRLMSADVLSLCQHKPQAGSLPHPSRLQTAMSLYSNNLCGQVLLVDNRVNSYTGLKKEFAAVCSRATEMHFPDLESQLESIRTELEWVEQWRQNQPVQGEEREPGTPASPGAQVSGVRALTTGDFYVTRHSNLAQLHVVFHMVCDDSLSSPDINSRHPVILGLRNVLKTASLCDVTTLTIPLLLAHDMSEEMTVSWCLKRAELVYKCMKGFMMEMTTWGGSDTKTLQFLVPKGISEEVFSSLSQMLPNIFRISNPLVVKTS